jgi:beta-N-acetylhexosaminidase
MKRLSIGLCLLAAACAARKPVGTTPPDVGTKKSWAEETLRAMSLEDKVGQLIYPRSNGEFLNEADPRFRDLILAAREGRIGGVVFFKGDPLETAAIANRLQEESPLPLLMASDYEWGAAMRVDGASRFPRAMAMGAGGTEDDMELEAEVTAHEARALGIHLLLGPVLDLNDNPDNPVIDTRSLGESPERVARLGVAYIRRAQASGVLATAKHFPGHGGTSEDSHLLLPVVSSDRSRLESENLVPFRAAIDAGVAAVMTAHVAFPALDSDPHRPATLSPEILEGVLRGELSFRGLIMSDALDMGGARAGAWDGEVAVSAMKAGVDMLLVPPDPRVTYRAVLRAVQRGDLGVARVDASVLRILEAKERLGLHRRRTVDLEDVPRRVANPFVEQRVRDIAARGVTLLQNRGGVLPFRSEAPPRILLVDYLPESDREIDPAVLEDELTRRAQSVSRLDLTPSSAPGLAGAVASSEAGVVVVASYARSRSLLGRDEIAPGLLEKLRGRVASGAPVVFASLGTPYVLASLPEASALVATYDFAPASQRALASALFGETAIGGKLPVRVSAEYPLGRGIDLPERRMKLTPVRTAAEAGMSSDGLETAMEVVENAVDDGAAPGAVVLVARRGRVVLEKAVGRMTYDGDSERVTRDTLYDLASLTKVVVTTTLSMIMTERGLLDLESPVSSYIPEFRGEGKDRVLVEDLLAHSGGILWWTDLYKKYEGKTPAEAKRGYLDTICELPLDYPPRAKSVYSDLGILLLGEILERITGRDLETLARTEIFEPLGMDGSLYRPSRALMERIAPTERDPWRGRVVRGEVHDENAYGLGGVAPHAGLFSTAASLARFAQMMLNGGAYNGHRILKQATIARFTRRANLVPGSSRALGWDTPSEPSAAGSLFSASSYGHTGFTGTSLWIDPERELFVILLTNRVYPTRENQKIFALRPALHDAVQKAILDVEVRPRPPQ